MVGHYCGDIEWQYLALSRGYNIPLKLPIRTYFGGFYVEKCQHAHMEVFFGASSETNHCFVSFLVFLRIFLYISRWGLCWSCFYSRYLTDPKEKNN